MIGPQPGPQEDFLSCDADVVFFGGSAGGGKSFALLLNPLYHFDNAKYGAVTFRRTTKQIRSEGGLWDTASDLYTKLPGTKPNQSDLSFTFPSGSRHTFAHMEYEKNRFDWQGSQIPTIQFDELTHFTWRQFVYMLSRNRSTSGVKGTIRATLNPDPDHWVRRWIDWWIGPDGFAIPERSGVIRYFVVDGDQVHWNDTAKALKAQFPASTPKSFTFIQSHLSDNKILMDADPGYLANLQALTRVERAQLLDGNWNVRQTAGMFFQRADFGIVDAAPVSRRTVRAWDQAATEKRKDSDDPDWTAGVKMSRGDDGCFYVLNVERFQSRPAEVDRRLLSTAEQDSKTVAVRLAQDPGQAGKSQAHSQTAMLSGYNVTAKPVTGDKQTRAKPLASQVEAGNVKLVRGAWNEAFLLELENFPDGTHDDQVDAAADAFNELASGSNYSLQNV